jgi:hypothetical protein
MEIIPETLASDGGSLWAVKLLKYEDRYVVINVNIEIVKFATSLLDIKMFDDFEEALAEYKMFLLRPAPISEIISDNTEYITVVDSLSQMRNPPTTTS